MPARPVRVVSRRNERAVATPTGIPDELEGPLPARTRAGTLVVRLRGRVVDRVPLVTSRALARASWWDRNRWITSPPAILLILVGAAVGAASLSRARGAPRAAEPAWGQERDRVIITVTLNAAIDKSLSVPNFRLGRRHRTVEQRTMPGGKGVNVARTLKTLGQPVIATGFAGGATGHAHRRGS